MSVVGHELFKPVAVEFEAENGREVFDFETKTFTKSVKEDTVPVESKVNFALRIKDKFCLSDEAYHELSFLSKDIPQLYKLKMESSSLNSSFDICEAPEGVVGVQQSLKTSRLKHLQLDPTQKIQVKLASDGISIGKNIHVINFTFTLLTAGNHALAIMQVPEKYATLSEALADIDAEARDLQLITVNGKTHELEFFLGGDMKF